MKKMNLKYLLFVCSVALIPALSSASTFETSTGNDSGWNVDARIGVGADKNYQELNCVECNTDDYNFTSLIGLDLTYAWSDFETGLSGTYNGALFKSPQFYVGATFGWRRGLTSWLEAKVTSEAGVHVMVDVVDDFMVTVREDSGDVVLPYLGARLSLDATVWEPAGLVLGLWGGAKFDLTKTVVSAEVEQWFSDGTLPEQVRAGGHIVAGGLTLGFEF